MPESISMVKGETFAFTVTLPTNAIADDLTTWTPSASMREGLSEGSAEILTPAQLVASIQDGPNRVILVSATAATTATVVLSGYVDVWIKSGSDQYRVKVVRVELLGRVTVVT
jgi:hypothetical protein